MKRTSLMTTKKLSRRRQIITSDVGIKQNVKCTKIKTLEPIESTLLRRQIIKVQKIRKEKLIDSVGLKQMISVVKVPTQIVKSTLNLSATTSQIIKGKKKTKERKGNKIIDVEIDI